jgi:hypothetical protein
MAIQDFTVGQILTAAQMDNLQANDYNQTVSTKTANYTLVAADKGTRVVMNAAGATTITVDDSLFSAGDTLQLQNIGAGVSTVTAGTATVSSAGPLAIPQYGSGTLFFTSAGVAIYFPSAVTVAAPPASALTLTGSATLSSTSTNITSCFSATYDNYFIFMSDVKLSASAGYITVELLVSTTPATTNYGYEGIYYKNAVQTGENASGESAWVETIYQNSASTSMGFTYTIMQPFLAVGTNMNSSNYIQGNFGRTRNLWNTNATSYDGIKFSQANGFASGKVRVYGLALS